MSDIDVTRLLDQMRGMAAAAGAMPGAENTTAGTGQFAGVLQQAIDQVSSNQQQASDLRQAYELGQDNVNLAEVMVAMQKASISFQAMVEVRNKLVSAYQEIMNMQV